MVSERKSLKDRLVGTWALVSWEQKKGDGSKVHRYGANRRASRFLVQMADTLSPSCDLTVPTTRAMLLGRGPPKKTDQQLAGPLRTSGHTR